MGKAVNYKKKFRYKSDKKQYEFQLRHRRWWLWLLLLPLLLLIRCERDLTVHAVDKETKEDLAEIDVNVGYNEYFIYKEGRFFGKDAISRMEVTDDDGIANFEGLPCSVFSYIFTCLTKVEVNAGNTCYYMDPSPVTRLFHFTKEVTLEMEPRRADLTWSVVDKETKDPLASALVDYRFEMQGREYVDSVRTDADGKCTLRGVPACGELTLTRVSCYGYKDTVNIEADVARALTDATYATTELEPLKTSFTFFVKNLYTKQPVPEAKVDVTLTSGHDHVSRGSGITNVDGKGRGEYGEAFVLAYLHLHASKPQYRDSVFVYDKGGVVKDPYTVEQFVALSDSDRVIYLEPEPYMEEFQNVDSISGKPIVGVKNEIRVEGIDGTVRTLTETSNRNGVFYVTARKGDRIIIESTHERYYDKKTDIKGFEKGEKIPMRPKTVDLLFRTVDADDGDLLDDCTLVISTSESHVTEPRNSGSGEFMVKGLYIYETISIKASKTDYGTNDTKVRNASVEELMSAPQSRRDIPLKLHLPPCDASSSGVSDVKAGHVSAPQTYYMGKSSGRFQIDYETGKTCSDCIEIYNHERGTHYTTGTKIFSTGQVVTDGYRSEWVNFNHGALITIIVTTGPKDGSLWNYNIHCPE